MKSLTTLLRTGLIMAILALTFTISAQDISNWRSYDQNGVNVFEPAKDLTTEFTGRTVRIGGAFTQQFQALSHSNGNDMELYALAPGFNLAAANLNIDAQIEDGIRISLESYMSSRHHTEFWVKGGYIQIDKLPMFNSPDWFSKYLRVKIGHFQPNYGDQMMRRTDNGNAMFNPFVGNYIMDAFTTEIGTEVYVFPVPNFVGMFGMTTGLIKDDIKEYTDGKQRQPSIYLKGAYNKNINDKTSFRLSGSFMMNGNAGRNTLFGGDRTGSRFNAVLELKDADLGSKAFAGRWNPGFSNKVTSFQVNPFVKVGGLELFGVIERASGNNLVNKEGKYVFDDSKARSVTQLGGEVIYRFLPNEQMYFGVKFDKLSGELNSGYVTTNGEFMNSNIQRFELVAGWFATKNLLLKAEYVNQKYTDFPNTVQYYEGQFSGLVMEAVAAF